LGHGVFNLKHSFDDMYCNSALNPACSTFISGNLLNYDNGKGLCKFQWDCIHDPAIVIGILESDKTAASYGSYIASNLRNFEDKSVNFLTPSKKIVRLPKEVIKAYFSFGLGDEAPIKDKDYKMLPSGVLTYFIVKNGDKEIVYRAKIVKENNHYYFKGYETNKGVAYTGYMNKTSIVNSESAIIQLPYDDGLIEYRLKGLSSYSYYTSNTSEEVLDILDASSANMGASEWKIENKYDHNRVSEGVGSNLIDLNYAGILKDIHNGKNNEEYLLVTKILEYRTVYPDLFERMTVSFNDWTKVNTWTSTLFNDFLNAADPINWMQIVLGKDKTLITAGYFDYYCKQNTLYSSSYSDVDRLILFIKEFEKMIVEQQKLYAGNISLLTSTCEEEDKVYASSLPRGANLMGTIEAMSVDQLQDICPNKRCILIANLLQETVVSERVEASIYSLMRSCPSGNTAAEFLLKFTQTRFWNQSNKDFANEYILGTLVTAVDDKTLFMGENYNTLLMNIIIGMYDDFLNYNGSNADILKYKSITKPQIQDADAIKNLTKRVITYNYASFTKRLFKGVLASMMPGGSSFVPGDMVSTASYDKVTNKVNFNNNMQKCFVNAANTTSPQSFDPLDPIILDDKGQLIDIYDKTSKGHFLPAYILYFVEKKGDAKTTAEIIQTGTDILALVIPGGQTTWALKLINYADKVSSVSSLVASTVALDNTKVAQVLNFTSACLGVTSAGAGYVASKIRYASDAGNLMQIDEAIDIIAVKNIAATSSDLLSGEKHADNIISMLNNINNDILSANGKIKSFTLEQKVLLVNILELEKEAAKAADAKNVIANIEKTIANIAKAGKLSVTRKLTNYFQTLASKSKLTFNANTGVFSTIAKSNVPAVQLGHLVDGEMVIDKIDDIGSLTSNAKIEEVMDEAIYMSGGQASKKDLVFFDDDGVIKCIGGGNCFTAHTPVLTKNGLQPIYLLQKGDSVMSYNELTKKSTLQRVTDVFSRVTQKLQRIITSTDTIYTTSEHPFYIKGRWVKAAAITAGMFINTLSGAATVGGNTSIDSSTTVYNFTVENTHTYYVGSQALLVHNTCQALEDILKQLGDKASDFTADFKGSPEKLKKFISGELDYRAWEVLKKNDAALATNEDLLKSITTWAKSKDNFISELNDPDVFKAYIAVRQDPSTGFNKIRDLMAQGIVPDAFYDYVKSKFFRDIMRKGLEFENAMDKYLKSIPTFIAYMNDGFKQYNQIILKGLQSSSKSIIVDNLLIKKITENGATYWRGVVND
ncbi:MAG: hypothetical protein HYZ42_00205, partial [Bacteroidetes bacterium]|nr:hypothetical protein [Bacteroidota bacterium]